MLCYKWEVEFEDLKSEDAEERVVASNVDDAIVSHDRPISDSLIKLSRET